MQTSLFMLREALGLSVGEFAGIVGLSASSLEQAENGEPIRGEQSAKLAAFFGSDWMASAVCKAPNNFILAELGLPELPAIVVRLPYAEER